MQLMKIALAHFLAISNHFSLTVKNLRRKRLEGPLIVMAKRLAIATLFGIQSCGVCFKAIIFNPSLKGLTIQSYQRKGIFSYCLSIKTNQNWAF